MGKGGGCMPTKNKFPINEPAERPVSQTDITGSEAEGSKKLRIFIVFYSMYGHVERLARRMKKGVDGIEGVEGVLYMVPEILAPDVLEQMKAPPKNDEIPVISVDELMEADGFLFGFPTRYGCMAAQMKAFFDSTGKLWREQKLAGLPAGFFVSTGTQGGGQETTAWTAVTQLAHHGMLYVPIGYTFGAGMFRMDSIIGGSPYGAGTFSGDGSREPSEPELALAEHQGKYMAMTVKRLAQHHSLPPELQSEQDGWSSVRGENGKGVDALQKYNTLIPVRPFRHNEYERFITAAFPYYGASFSMMGGFFLFSLVYLYHK